VSRRHYFWGEVSEGGRSPPPRVWRGSASRSRSRRRGESVTWSLLIRNGSVVDGTGGPARRADVAVERDRVAAVGPGLRGDAPRVSDAAGQVVAPGLLDAHSHSDLFYFGC